MKVKTCLVGLCAIASASHPHDLKQLRGHEIVKLEAVKEPKFSGKILNKLGKKDQDPSSSEGGLFKKKDGEKKLVFSPDGKIGVLLTQKGEGKFSMKKRAEEKEVLLKKRSTERQPRKLKGLNIERNVKRKKGLLGNTSHIVKTKIYRTGKNISDTVLDKIRAIRKLESDESRSLRSFLKKIDIDNITLIEKFREKFGRILPSKGEGETKKDRLMNLFIRLCEFQYRNEDEVDPNCPRFGKWKSLGDQITTVETEPTIPNDPVDGTTVDVPVMEEEPTPVIEEVTEDGEEEVVQPPTTEIILPIDEEPTTVPRATSNVAGSLSHNVLEILSLIDDHDDIDMVRESLVAHAKVSSHHKQALDLFDNALFNVRSKLAG